MKELNNIKIQQLRLQLGMSQDDLAKAVGVSRRTIGKIETGKTKNPKKELIYAIAKVLLVNVEELEIT